MPHKRNRKVSFVRSIQPPPVRKNLLVVDQKSVAQDRLAGGALSAACCLASAAGFAYTDHLALGVPLVILAVMSLIVAVRAYRRIGRLDHKLRLREELLIGVIRPANNERKLDL